MDISTALAHKDPETGREQLLLQHLHNVAELTSAYASHFGCSKSGYTVGLYHDLGKCSEGFAKRLLGGPIVDHATMGAYALICKKQYLEAIAVASHHTGLQNMGFGDKYEAKTFSSRLKNFEGKKEAIKNSEELESVSSDGELSMNHAMDTTSSFAWFLAEHFLFSSLVDADYTDTGRFYGTYPNLASSDFVSLCKLILERADKYLLSESCESSHINNLRNAMLRECLRKSECVQGLYTLTMPTGSGKTFSSLAFAARHALLHRNIRRIIYVIPYLSIIEQNAEVIRKIVGNENVLEHHSVSPIFVDEVETEEISRLQFASENWDIPIVVTTNEQFFETLFSAKSRKCRKIHNISDSVIIFDETQMLPLKYLKLFMTVIEELVASGRYGVTALFCTATQPSLGRFLSHGEPKEIIDSTLSGSPVFRRNHVEDICKESSFERICDMVSSYSQALVIVNRKRDAKEIYENLPEEGRFYLTTNLTPNSRRRIIKEIKSRLEDNLICRVVSTSLIEAGVDVDFPVVFRELNGLDSIVQAAGRCNRNGNKQEKESIVYVFDLGNMPNYADYSRKIYAYMETSKKYADILSPDAISEYYSLYYQLSSTDAGMDLFACRLDRLPFAEIGDSIKIIEEDDIGIFIRQNEEAEDIYQEISKNGINRRLLRRAAEYTVRCPRKVVSSLIKQGDVEMIAESFTVLTSQTQYNENTGYDYSSFNESEALFF